ncbi:MAG TPA: hypothetical protein VIW45_02640 [Vicinamibacterales bacterium]|jgi:hypothetical protein
MNLTRTAAFLAGAAALAALVFGAVTARHEVPAPIVVRPAAIDRRGADLAKEIAKLHERLRPDAMPRQPGRNLFNFHASRAAAAPPVADARPALVEVPSAPPPPAALPFKLVGIAEDAGASGAIRTAFISGAGQLFVAKEGDAVTPRFKVTKISPDAVEITDTTDGSARRLVLK